MQAQTPHRQLELPSGMRSRLEAFRGRVWVIKLTEGALAAAFGLFVSYLVVFAADRLWDTPAWLRALFLVVGSVGLSVWLPYVWHRWVWRTRKLDQVARLVRRRLPRLGDQLLGVVELVEGELKEHRSEALCRAAMKQVDVATRERELYDALPRPRRRPWAWAAGVPAVITLLALAVVPAAGTNALLRWLMPWTPTERYTFARLDDLPGRMVVPYGEPFSLTTSLREDTAWAPRQGHARYGEQKPVGAPLTDGAYRFRLPPQKEPASLMVSVGDADRSIAIQPTARPELTAMTARVTLPAYLRYSSDLSRDVRGGSVSLLIGSEATFEATATRELADASVDGVSIAVQSDRMVTLPIRITEGSTREFTWRDHLGLSAKEPFLLSIKTADDDPPSLSTSRVSREQVVLEEEVLSFEVIARDDFGVKTVGMEWAGVENPVRNPQPARGEKIVAAGGPEERELEAVATFSAAREGVKPQTLELRLFVFDYLPDREPVYSPTYIVHVLSPEEHAIWLTQQLGKWFRSARNVYERERRLLETNRELRQLAAEDIDRPENRRRIETQAAAETANAARLSSLTASGEKLIKEAARNDQFNVATMETWAAMLQALKDIAANRMPSVADLLQQAASAPGSLAKAQPGRGSPSPAESKPSPPGVGVRRDSRSGGGAPSKSESKSPSKVPGIADVESGFNELDDRKSQASPSPSSRGRLGLPVTVVQGGGAPGQTGNASCPAGQKMEEAVEEQEDLLAEFARVAEELQRILDNLEGSTFVKRLKAASRAQSEMATSFNSGLSRSFGVREDSIDERVRRRSVRLAEREISHSENVYFIREDLAAYSDRVQEGKFRTVLNEMRSTEVVSNLRGIAETAKDNLGGQSIAHAEFWADTLDRWAEQLVGPG